MRERKQREIKFRQENKGKWHYWGFIDDGFITPLQGEGGGKSYQFTGLKDKNGKEIFEGDIVKNWDWEENAHADNPLGEFEVSWSEEEIRFNGIIGETFEVIGNIYENPENLKKEIKRKNITMLEAEEAWEKMKDSEFMRIHYPEFSNYWAECQRINNLDDGGWYKLIKENQQKLRDMGKRSFTNLIIRI